MIGYGNSVFLRTALGGGGGGVDPDAQAFITAAAITDPTQQAAINTLVVDLKGYSIWSKMKALYPFVTDNRNLLSFTEDFGNAFWLKYNTSISANAINAPNGTLTADELNEGATSNYHGFKTTLNGLTPNSTWGASISLKYNNRRYVSIGWYINASPYPSFGAIIDTQNKTIVSSSNTLTASIELQSNDWFRVKLTGNIGNYTNDYTFQVSLLDDSLNEIYLGTNKSVYVWGSQIEIGTSVTAYQAITFTPQAFMASQHKFNLKDPRDLDAAFRLVFNGGWTHSSTGATPNGTNAFADTKFNPVTNSLAYNDNHLSYYSRTQTAGATSFYEIGSGNTGNGGTSLFLRRPDSTSAYDCGTASANRLLISPVTDGRGFYVGSGISTNVGYLFKNGVQQQIKNPLTSVSMQGYNYYIGGFNEQNSIIYYSDKQVAFSSIGNGLTTTEMANFYTAVQTFQTTLLRQV
jgi:hypothetical protein